MSFATLKETAINKITELTEEEVSKVNIFIDGLNAGMEIKNERPVKKARPKQKEKPAKENTIANT